MTLPLSSSSPSPPPALQLRGHGFSYGQHAVLAPFALDLRARETVAILGPSGGGKSTLLKQVAGLLPGLETPVAETVAWMAQQDLLLPWASIRENVLLGARLRGEQPDIARAESLLRRLGLSAWMDAYPAALSGGMRQRAALARTLMEDRPLVLMDEPFSALDAITRAAMQELACELLQDRMVLLVTHDPAEACRIADRVLLLAGHPAQLRPVTDFAMPAPRDPLSPAVLPALRLIHAALQEPLP